jgi:hypothetical protein
MNLRRCEMKVKTSEAKDQVLSYLVGRAEGIELSNGCYNRLLVDGRMSTGQKMLTPYNPSTDWAQAGPIIEREKIALDTWGDEWLATRIEGSAISEAIGPTPLIAAMRCYVASKLGDEVEVPDELA